MEFHGPNGKPLRTSLAGAHGLKQLRVVTIKGKIHKDSRGNITVIGEKMHIEK